MSNLVDLEQFFINVLFWAALAASALFLLELVLKASWARWAGVAGMGVGLACSLASMVIRYMYAGYPPLSNLFESLVALIFGVLLIYQLVHWTMKPRLFGIVAAPLVTVLVGFASILPPSLRSSHPLMPALQSYWLKIHVSLMILSYSAFMVAFGVALIYLVLFYTKGRASAGGTLAVAGGTSVGSKVGAQLEFFEDLTYRLILGGFPVLALGIITGGMWANHAWGTYWSWDPKETWSLITWLVYAGYLHMRLTRDWRDQRAAWMAVVGFVSVLVTYLGVNYLAGSLHTYGKLL